MAKGNGSLKNIVYQKTLDGIIQGEYKANQIINESELVEKYGFSKSPVREALISLCNDGVLRNLPRYGYEVIRLTSRDAEDILRFRFLMESGFLRECYESITQTQLEELYRLDDLCNASVDDMWLHWEHNTNFHLALLSCARNEYAWDQLKRSMGILKRAYAQFYWDKWDKEYNPIDMRYHRDILDCIEKKDIEGATKKLELDLREFKSV